MTISYVGSAAAEATSITLPSHQAGDLILFYATANSNVTITAPSGWSTSNRRLQSANISSVSAFKIANSSSETSGTWTNATLVCVAIYRHTTDYLFVNARTNQAANATTSINYPTISSAAATGASPTISPNSWVGAFAVASANNTDFETAPTGMVNRISLAGASVAEIVLHDTDGVVSIFTGVTRTNSGAVNYHSTTFCIEPTGVSKSGGAKPVNPFNQQVIG